MIDPTTLTIINQEANKRLPEGYEAVTIIVPMNMGEGIVQFETNMKKQDFITLLRAIADGLVAGKDLPPQQMN